MQKAKLCIGWVACWVLYGVGHALSRPLLWWDSEFTAGLFYRPYNWCMFASSDVQEWSGCKGPWQEEIHESA